MHRAGRAHGELKWTPGPRPRAGVLLPSMLAAAAAFILSPVIAAPKSNAPSSQPRERGSQAAPGGTLKIMEGPKRPGGLTTYASGDSRVGAYLVTPNAHGSHPGLIVIHEWWGLNDQIKGVADELSSKGYVTLAPDLYDGKATTDPAVAMELMRSLDQDRAARKLADAAAYLRSLPAVEKKPIGSIGFCMGGGLSLQLALLDPKLAACVICYGRLESDPAKLKAIGAPILGIFGGTDTGIPREMIDGFRKGLEADGKSVEIKIYPQAGHGFMNPNNPSHRPDDTKDAWTRINAFFAKSLPPK